MQVGEELAWLKEHKPEFQRRANAGQEHMQDLMTELATRPEFAGL